MEAATSARVRKIITNILIAIGMSLLVNFADMLFVRSSRQFQSQLIGSSGIMMDTVEVQGRSYIIPITRDRMRRDSVNMTNAQFADSIAALKPLLDSLFRAYVMESMAKSQADTSLIPASSATSVDTGDRRMLMPPPGMPGPFGFGPNPGYTRDFSWISQAVKQSPPYQRIKLVYFFLLGFVILSVALYQPRDRNKPSNYLLNTLLCLMLAVMGYFLAPNVAFSGEIVPTFRFFRHAIYDTDLLLKCALVFFVAALYGRTYQLTSQRQKILLENEKLKSENLQATYSTLINQMNPHFFFNSLNSLSMLVREKHNTQALKYIDRLSDTFRYILQNGASGMIPLEEELKFTDAYKYLLEMRYEGKLFVDMDVAPSYMQWMLPSFTLQPLIENAVKHNSITRSRPLRITIASGDGDSIGVSNTVIPRMDEGTGTGIGLSNLSERYRLLTGKEITIIHDDREFTVILPLIPPKE